ncbi:MAG: AAA family ATPase [Satyrvirus sp.]|uniref:AAA family ATPase n=1 Tax=Satyrvirus sp. TaxID=2487771 RepID=A0A3G5AGX2_9VIRU|nr:MAG: AAA family ATPase [Satyrvirus sp.]
MKKEIGSAIRTTLSTIFSAVFFGIIAGFAAEFNTRIKYIFKFINDQYSYCATIKGEKCIYALKNEIMNHYKNKLVGSIVEDGVDGPEYKLDNTTYILLHNGKNVYISLYDDKIEMWIHTLSSGDSSFLKSYLDEIYDKHIQIDNPLIFYTPKDDQWGYPIFRRPLTIKPSIITPSMATLLADVKDFIESEDLFKRNGMPFRKGYLVEGETGTGKSLITEIIATKYNMNICLLNLNVNNYDDNVLLNLFINVKPRSLIVVDELEKQYTAIKSNSTIHISDAGILSALDGPARLSHGTIVVLTANDITKIPKDFRDFLLRKGRIDVCQKFIEKV